MLFAAFLALAAAAGQTRPAAAPAPQPTPSPRPVATMIVEPVAMMLAGFDRDGDGVTTRAEADTAVARSFAALDPQHGGSIGYIAFADWAERWLGDRNALPSPFEVDTDGDNRITAAELDRAVGRVFDRLDRDHDGRLTHAELLTVRSGFGERRPGDRRGRNDDQDNGPPRRR